jgi:hypothetical protein
MRTIGRIFAITLLAGCVGAEPGPGRLHAALGDTAAGQQDGCAPKTSEVLYLGPCQIPPGGSYTLPETSEECRVISAVDTLFEGMRACRETRSCAKRPCLPTASFSQAPMQGTAAPESFDPNMIGD